MKVRTVFLLMAMLFPAVNRLALRLHGIDDDHFDHAAEAVEEDRIVELLAGAGMYVSY